MKHVRVTQISLVCHLCKNVYFGVYWNWASGKIDLKKEGWTLKNVNICPSCNQR